MVSNETSGETSSYTPRNALLQGYREINVCQYLRARLFSRSYQLHLYPYAVFCLPLAHAMRFWWNPETDLAAEFTLSCVLTSNPVCLPSWRIVFPIGIVLKPFSRACLEFPDGVVHSKLTLLLSTLSPFTWLTILQPCVRPVPNASATSLCTRCSLGRPSSLVNPTKRYPFFIRPFVHLPFSWRIMPHEDASYLGRLGMTATEPVGSQEMYSHAYPPYVVLERMAFPIHLLTVTCWDLIPKSLRIPSTASSIFL